MRNPLTPAGIEPATFRFVAQHLNRCATAVHQTIKSFLIELKNTVTEDSKNNQQLYNTRYTSLATVPIVGLEPT